MDIQGVLDLYTDPVIHFLPSRVSGETGRTHKISESRQHDVSICRCLMIFLKSSPSFSRVLFFLCCSFISNFILQNSGKTAKTAKASRRRYGTELCHQRLCSLLVEPSAERHRPVAETCQSLPFPNTRPEPCHSMT